MENNKVESLSGWTRSWIRKLDESKT